MKKHFYIAGLTFLSTLAIAPAAFAACEHYAGHFDLEGKIGNTRNLGEASAFLPITCTQDRLLFTDLKFRADNLSNREANIGIGGRLQREDGIAGGYIYFDRKKSGETDKFYTQITTGAEWLADHWETRANLYIPLNGAKNVSATTTTSDPYLAGSNIFIDQAGFVVKETPMYGADAEIGFNTIENLWLYGGGFTFNGNDVPTITGARLRAKYDLTDKVSLNAEGQYDDERGRQGWLGARLSVPFGNTNATRSRMTQSPVRDIDIVTQTKQQQTSQTTTALTNPNSGDAQRIIYVDNRAAANGDGSLESPYNSLADAQNDLRDYDIVYIYHGNGSANGMDQGFVIDKRNIRIIGEGSPLIYQGYTLKAAGQKPLLTNINPSPSLTTGAGILVNGADIEITGLRIEEAQGVGILASLHNSDVDHLIIRNVDVIKNRRSGIQVLTNGATTNLIEVSDSHIEGNRLHGITIGVSGTTHSRAKNVVVRNISSVDNGIYHDASQAIGILVTAGNDGGTRFGAIDSLVIDDVLSQGNISQGLFVRSMWGSEIGHAQITRSTFDTTVSLNGSGNPHGAVIMARGGVIERLDLDQIQATNARGAGLFIYAMDDGSIEDALISNVAAHSNGSQGLRFQTLAASTLNARVINSDFINNAGTGLFVDDDSTTNTLNANLNGNNRLFGNAANDLVVDLNGRLEPLDARNNWWGQEEGPLAGQIRSASPGVPPAPNTGNVNSDDWLTEDPRP